MEEEDLNNTKDPLHSAQQVGSFLSPDRKGSLLCFYSPCLMYRGDVFHTNIKSCYFDEIEFASMDDALCGKK